VKVGEERGAMSVVIGNHLKMHLSHHHREKASRFYMDILGCRKLVDKPYPNVDLYEFQGGFILGLFFCDEKNAPDEGDYLKATWMEIKTDKPEELKQKLIEFGVRQVEFEDTSRFYRKVHEC